MMVVSMDDDDSTRGSNNIHYVILIHYTPSRPPPLPLPEPPSPLSIDNDFDTTDHVTDGVRCIPRHEVTKYDNDNIAIMQLVVL